VATVKGGAVFSVAVDEATTCTTKAAYRAVVHENAYHISSAAALAAGDVNPQLDISGHATTNTLTWNIIGIDPTMDNRDFAGTGVRLLVVCNLPEPGTTGV